MLHRKEFALELVLEVFDENNRANQVETVQIESETQVAANLAPQRRFPAIHFQDVGIKGCNWHRRRWLDDLVERGIIGRHLKVGCGLARHSSQAVDGQAQAWQHIVIHDVFKKNSLGIERLFFKDDAICKVLVLANRPTPVRYPITLCGSRRYGCEPAHKTDNAVFFRCFSA